MSDEAQPQTETPPPADPIPAADVNPAPAETAPTTLASAEPDPTAQNPAPADPPPQVADLPENEMPVETPPTQDELDAQAKAAAAAEADANRVARQQAIADKEAAAAAEAANAPAGPVLVGFLAINPTGGQANTPYTGRMISSALVPGFGPEQPAKDLAAHLEKFDQDLLYSVYAVVLAPDGTPHLSPIPRDTLG